MPLHGLPEYPIFLPPGSIGSKTDGDSSRFEELPFWRECYDKFYLSKSGSFSRFEEIPNWRASNQTLIDTSSKQFRDHDSWSPLCSPCISRLTSGQFQVRKEGVRDGYQILELGYETTPLEVKRSSDQNCTLCQVIAKAIRAGHREAQRLRTLNSESSDPYNVWRVEDFQLSGSIKVWLELVCMGQYFRFFQFELPTKNGLRIVGPCFRLHARMKEPAAKYIGPREMITDVASPDSFAQAIEWLRECTEEHVDCPRTKLEVLPKRVVDVSPPRGEESVCIYESERVTEKYAALSYCWGGKQETTLRTDTIKEFCKAIPLNLLPKTLTDAIFVTRRLGLRYVWIDALCILQDSKADKKEEIPKIREIFKNAHCTISAASAFSASSGFLQRRPPSCIEELRIPLRPRPDDELDTVILHYDHQLPSFDEKTEPIERRAWTLEEKMLSPRVLIYSSSHLRWLCMSSPLTVDLHAFLQGRFRGTTGDRPQINKVVHQGRLKITTADGSQIIDGTDISYPQRYQLYSGWASTIREYTRRSLTDPHDVFRAISGIAREYESILQEDYIAGMWSGNFASQLLWWVAPEHQLRPTSYRAPSWSWASAAGEIILPTDKDLIPGVRVEKWSTTPAPGQGPTGELIGGYVVIRGPTKKAWWKTSGPAMKKWWTTPKNEVWDLTTRLGPKITRGTVLVDSRDDDEAEPSPVIVLRMTSNSGLALKPAIPQESSSGSDGETPIVYRRVGIFCTQSDEYAHTTGDEFWEDFEEAVITIV